MILLTALLLLDYPLLTGAAEFTLGTADPYVNPDGLCALVEAIVNANEDAQTHQDCPTGSGADVITLGAPVVLDGSTLFPASSPVFFDTGDSGLPEITSDITIRDGEITRTGAEEFRFFVVLSTGSLTLEKVTVSQGRAVGHCQGFTGGDFSGCGGAIVVNQGSLTLSRSIFKNNSAEEDLAADSPFGGVVMMFGGTLDINESLFFNNHAEYGGAIGGQNTTANIVESVFNGNSAVTSGAGIYNGFGGDFTIAGTRFRNNEVTSATTSFNGGGAIDNAGSSSGLTVINGEFIGNSASNGGAINNYNASQAFIVNSRFSNNNATVGGAILNHGSGASLNVFSSTIENNTALKGAGIANGNLQTGIATVVDTVMTGNDATFDGGGILTRGTLSVRNTLLEDNIGGDGGGIFVDSGSNQVVIVESSTFANNFASSGGGGLYFTVNPSEFVNTLTITDSTFDNNEADEGGGLYAEVVDVTVSGSTFTNNLASGVGGGGGIHIRSFIVTGSEVNISNSTLSDNSASQDGGGIFLSGSTISALISSSTIAGNTAGSSSGGDGIHNLALAADVLVRDVILHDNEDRNCLDAASFGVTDGGNNISSDATCNFSDTGGGVGDGVNPLIDPLADNGGQTHTHALQAESPAIDNGGANCPALDQRGAPRNGDCDIGAFEADSPPAVLTIATDTASLFESEATVATISVTLDNTSPGARALDIDVPFRVTGSASGSGFDYSLSNQNGTDEPPAGLVNPLSFSVAPGTVTIKTVTLMTIDDALYEADETILIDASVFGNAQFSGNTRLSLTVFSDDPAFRDDGIFLDGFEFEPEP